MLEYKNGDILAQDTEAIVNTVNCVGVMGRGLALQYKNKFPQNYKEYALACKNNEVVPGKMFVHQTQQLMNPKYIINFPTKRHWKGKSKIEDIEGGLDNLIEIIKQRQIKSISIPPLGSGLGGLEWKEVKNLISKKMMNVDCKIVVFEPLEQKIEKNISKEVPKMTAGRAALIELMDRYLKGLMDPVVSLLEIHKLMYFMQEAGEPLRLQYQKATYGPYAQNLRHVLNKIEGHFIVGYEDGGDAPDKQIGLLAGAIDDSKNYLQDKNDTKERFERVSNLIDGFETPYGLELLATVHWVMKNDKTNNIDETIKQVYAWNSRKKEFSHKQIATAYNHLIKKEWITI